MNDLSPSSPPPTRLEILVMALGPQDYKVHTVPLASAAEGWTWLKQLAPDLPEFIGYDAAAALPVNKSARPYQVMFFINGRLRRGVHVATERMVASKLLPTQ